MEGDFVQLSVLSNWRFVHANEAFCANWQINDRVLYVLSDAASSGTVGYKMEDLLRTIPNKRENGSDTFHFEPKNIHYKALRKAFFEVIETELVETDGQPVKFGSGECSVTLHFKTDFLAT